MNKSIKTYYYWKYLFFYRMGCVRALQVKLKFDIDLLKAYS
ncbi:hypothetical protein [Acetobacterium wieringae]|nr:hypothetical protein [Acetobacterium wieringae]